MGQLQNKYESATEWRDAAMSRPNGVGNAEAEQRRSQADVHNHLHHVIDPDVLVDQQLYTLGKMGMEEYQAYLLFKHGKSG